MIDSSKGYGLVLEGGGARGAYEVGVWKALHELDIKIKGVVGTSVGSLNGALLVQQDLDKALDIWENIKYSKVMDVDDYLFDHIMSFNFKEIDLPTLLDKLKKITFDKGVDITPLKNLIDEVINEEKIRKSSMDFGLVTVSLSDFKSMELFIEDIPEGELKNYLMASSYLPGFKKEKINGTLFLDGGFYNNTPITMLEEKGYKDIIVVRILKFNIDQKTQSKDLNIIEIHPREELCNIIHFNDEKAKYNINLGYYDTFKKFYELKGSKYYIDSNKTERYFVSRFMRLTESVKRKVTTSSPVQRKFIEEGVGDVAKKLKLKKDWTYGDLSYTIIEFVASKLELERFYVYEYKELVDLIQDRLDEYKELVNYEKSSKTTEHIIADFMRVL